MMEMAKVTSKGQITIPISIRRRLGIAEGNKILFINKQDGVLMVNPDTVQGDLSDYTADPVPVQAAPAPAPAAPAKEKPAAGKVSAAPAFEKPAAAEEKVPAPEPAKAPAAAKAPAPVEPPKRKYIPPVEEPYEKPAPKAGGIDLSTLLDDIRSIGDI